MENKAAESSHSVNAWARLSSRQFSAAHGASIQLVSLSKMEPRTRNRHKPYGTRITCTRNRHKPYGTRNTAQRIGTTNTAHGIGTRITCTRITAHGIGTRNRHKFCTRNTSSRAVQGVITQGTPAQVLRKGCLNQATQRVLHEYLCKQHFV